MSLYEQTLNNFSEYIAMSPHIVEGYEVSNGYYCVGYEYTLNTGETVNIQFDRYFEFVAFEVYKEPCGTIKTTDVYEKIKNRAAIGQLIYDGDKIYYRLETSFADNPLSIRLIGKIESLACKALEMLATNAHDPLYGINEVPVKEQERLLDSCKTIRKCLAKSGFKLNERQMGKSNQLSYNCELIQTDVDIHGLLSIKHGFLSIAYRLENKIDPLYRKEADQICNHESNNLKYGSIKILDDGYPYITVTTYLLDGETPISENTSEAMQRVLDCTYYDLKDRFEKYKYKV